MIGGSDLIGYLPKRCAYKQHTDKEQCTAAIFMIAAGKIFLSQRLPQSFRRVTEAVLAPAIREGKVRVRRAASIVNSAFAKVSVEVLGGLDSLTVFLQHLEKVRNYTDDIVTIVRYSPDIKEYIVNSVVAAQSRPGPIFPESSRSHRPGGPAILRIFCWKRRFECCYRCKAP